MRRSLPLLAALSAVAAVLLALTCVTRVGVSYVRPVVARSSSTADLDLVIFNARGGRLVFYVGRESLPTTFRARLRPAAGWRLLAPSFEGVGRLHAREALWGFDAHVLTRTAADYIWVFSVPAWAIGLPCLVAPWLWWQARRRASAGRAGFAVLPSAAADPR